MISRYTYTRDTWFPPTHYTTARARAVTACESTAYSSQTEGYTVRKSYGYHVLSSAERHPIYRRISDLTHTSTKKMGYLSWG